MYVYIQVDTSKKAKNWHRKYNPKFYTNFHMTRVSEWKALSSKNFFEESFFEKQIFSWMWY